MMMLIQVNSRCRIIWCNSFQQDLNCIEGWSKLTRLPLNLIKSYYFHYGKSFVGHDYKLDDAAIIIVNDQLDLGVLRSSKTLSYKNHIDALYRKVNRMTGLMLRTFECRTSTFMLLLWKTYLRPILEYASQVWNDSYHAQRLEKIQRTFTKEIGGVREVPYENRLSRLELPTLSMRRLYLDLKFTHKLLKNKLNVYHLMISVWTI